MGIDRQSFAVAARELVAAQFEGQVGTLERAATVLRTQNGAVTGFRIGVSAGREIHAFGIGGVDRQAFDTSEIDVFDADPIGQRHPALVHRIPPIGAAYIGTRVRQSLFGGMEHQAGDEAAAADGHVVPPVGDLSG